MPPGIPYIIGNEAAERFSFYGMRTILVIFMTQYLMNTLGADAFMPKEEAKEWYHYFVTAVYFLPIFGAVAADWLFGKYPTIMGLSIVYCLGHGVLALMDSPVAQSIEPRTLLWIGLILIAVGSGGIKPCVSSHVGDQFGTKNKHLVTKVYSWFYFSINFGSFFSTLLTPILLSKYGSGWAFGVPGILMAIATFMFWMGRDKYVHIPPSGDRFFKETFSRDGMLAILNLIPLYIVIMMFWALFDQSGSEWVLQAEHMNRGINIGFNIPGLTNDQGVIEVLSSQIQAINPLLVMIMIPAFAYGLYPFLNRFIALTSLRKIGAGLFLTVLAFVTTGYVEHLIEQGQQPHIIWHLWAYIILTAAEIMVSITTLEFSYTQAPKTMKSFIQGLYLMSTAMGNFFTGWVNGLIPQIRPAKEGVDKVIEYGLFDILWIIFLTASMSTIFLFPCYMIARNLLPDNLKVAIRIGFTIIIASASGILTYLLDQFFRDAMINGTMIVEGQNYYWFFAGCMLATSVVFLVWSPFYRGKYILQDTTETAT